jgi:hypothetical protein
MNLMFEWHVFVVGEAEPPPGHAPPALLGSTYYIHSGDHMDAISELYNCVLLSVHVCLVCLGLSWDRVFVPRFQGYFKEKKRK